MMNALLLVVGTVTGTVTVVSSRWAGDAIITEAKVRDPSGTTVTIVQLGGSVGGLGMTFTHQPSVMREGDHVTIDRVSRRVLAVIPARAHTTAVADSARYGLQRTVHSQTSLWRDSGCIELTYDATTIDPMRARVLDAAFATWSSAALGCGRIVVTSTRRPRPPVSRDELNTVTVRAERWCNPGNPLQPEVCYAKEAAAVTRLLFVDDPSDPDDGKILDADIELNAVDYTLLAPGEPAQPTTKPLLDLQAVATHEAGHLLGLAHNCGTGDEAWPTDEAGTPVPACVDASSEVRAATMFYAVAPGEDLARSVESTDVAGLCALVTSATCEQPVTGGCDVRRGGASTGFLLGWILLARRHRRKAPARELARAPCDRSR